MVPSCIKEPTYFSINLRKLLNQNTLYQFAFAFPCFRGNTHNVECHALIDYCVIMKN